jgi:hypothetical protein
MADAIESSPLPGLKYPVLPKLKVIGLTVGELHKRFCDAYGINQVYNDEFLSLYDGADFDPPYASEDDEKIVVRSMLVGGEDNDYGEAGLYLVNHDVAAQKRLADKKIAEFGKEHHGLELAPLDVVGYLLLDAIRRELGEPLLDVPTWTRFIYMDAKRPGGGVCVPEAYAYDGSLKLDGRWVERSLSRAGVRFSVGDKES